MEGYRQVELALANAKQLRPKLAREDGVPVADNGAWHTVELNDGIEECRATDVAV
jgi:hypothetical protein